MSDYNCPWYDIIQQCNSEGRRYTHRLQRCVELKCDGKGNLVEDGLEKTCRIMELHLQAKTDARLIK